MAEAKQEHISVVARLRPCPKPSSTVRVADKELVVQVPRGSDTINNQVEEYSFRFARVFGPDAAQQQVFDFVAKDMVLGAMDGVNCSIFAYGQTGSGKTHTICGDHKDRGIIPRSLNCLFDAIDGRHDGVDYSVSMSFIEVYKEVGYDLLSKDFGRNQESWPTVSVSLQSGEAVLQGPRCKQDPDDAAEKVGILLEQRGFCVIPANLDSSVAEMDIHLLRDLGCLQRTPEEVLDAYFGSASTWTYELEPSDDAPEDFAGLYALDSELQEIGCIVSEAQMFSQRAVSRSAGLLHCDEMFFDEEPEDGPRLSDPSEAAPYLAHCTQRKVVLLFAFQDADVTLQPRSDLSDAIDVDIPAGSILVCLHEAVVLSVARSSLLLQLDLLLECGGQHKTKEELLPVPSSLMRQYAKMIESVKDSAPSDAPMLSLKDAHLDRSEGISIVSLFTELPTLPQDNGLGAAVQASLLGGLDTVREVVQPPKTARLAESQYFGAKWDLDEYFDEDPRGDDFKVYSKHLSVLYRSYDVAGDFDYRYFGFDKAESYDLDQRCRLLCEGTERALHEAGHLPKSRVARSWGLFSGLSGVRELLPVRSMLKSSPAAILGQVSEAFDFTGPVMALDTGDSSGLVASQTAVEQLRRSCDVALVSSASWISSPLELALHCATGSVSRTGRTRTFDQSADGFTQGEGVVVAMLQASGARDGRGHVVGTAMNSQGRGASLSAPSSAAMQEVLVKAERDARVPFVVVDAVETSSVGSSRTDAVELAVLGAALRHKDPQPVMVGCSKASFSHTGPSSGLASLAKAIFLMEKNCFGPQLHLSRLLTLAADPKRLQFCTEATQGLGHKQLASVAAFSASGSNCQQLISVNPRQKGIPQKAHQLSWWPTQVKKKDVLVPITGYYLACSLSAWQEAIPLNRDEDEPGSFSCVLQLRDDGRSQSVRAHERSVAAGLRRTLERHLQVNGLVPFDPATQKSAHFVKAPEWYNDGRRKEASIPTQHLINECQERIWQRQKMMKEEGPDAVLRQLRERA
ncbi:unnamed protein product [Effrenium voratum]|nr:unnamed protein product [Effrenium voratum]